ncbi:MAG: AGE family epimerase/isomerase [Siphonobacter aquaeclarae]|nr:AGE family epimerase/isomerase [Siphonobacter aquaeclarae]
MKKWAICLLFPLQAWAQQPYAARVDQLRQTIQQVFYQPATGLYLETNDPKHNEKPVSYLWPLCALIQAATEAEQVQPSLHYMPTVLKAIEQYRNDAPPASGYQAYIAKAGKDTRFYDDNQWVAIAALDAYRRTKKPEYLELGERIYRFMMTGYDEQAGGGIYWKEDDKTTKNTCSNGPGVLVALQLYELTKKPEYLTVARKIYTWTHDRLRAPDGLYYDALKLPKMTIDSARYTYNAGTMLQSAAILYRLTGEQAYLTEAQTIAKASEAYFFRKGRFPDHQWFNAVLLRGYIELYHIDHNRAFIALFEKDLNRIWAEERDPATNLIGKKAWKTLIDQAAVMEMFARLEQLK